MATTGPPTTASTRVRKADAGAVGGHPGRLSRLFTREERRRPAAMAAFILALHLVGWFTLMAVVAPGHSRVNGQSFGLGTGVTAYALGMRHAFDADHIAALDNTTRKLMHPGRRRPRSVGFWFSPGHSGVVFARVHFGVTTRICTG